MKNNQYIRQAQYKNGFIVPLLILIVAALAIGGGVYVYQKNKESTQDSPSIIASTTVTINSEVKTSTSTKSSIVNTLSVKATSTTQVNTGFLIPSATTPPQGFKLFTERVTDDGGYAVQYNIDDVGRLIINEHLNSNEYSNYKSLVTNMDKLSTIPNQDINRVQDVHFQGLSGVLYQDTSYGKNSFTLYLQDNDKYLRIDTNDGRQFHFTSATVIGILKTLIRKSTTDSMSNQQNYLME